ncbi:MAG: TlpA family protein disulfide reductase [Wolinella sp.]
MRVHLLGFFAVIFGLFFVGCENSDMETLGIKSEIITQKHAGNLGKFALELSDGSVLKVNKREKELFFEGEEGKAVLLLFFATWRAQCKAEIPHLVNLKNNYKNSLEIVGILTEDTRSAEEMRRFVETFEINFKIAISDENQKLAKALGGIPSIPFMILYNPKGEYVNHYIGIVPEEMLEFDIKRALREQR